MGTKKPSCTGPSGGKNAAGIREWSACWETFLAAHAAWWSPLEGGGPVYTLPEEVVDALSEFDEVRDGRHRARKRVLSEDEAEAEHAFRSACEGFAPDVVGVWGGRPVHYPPFARPVRPPVSPDLLKQMQWDQSLRPGAVGPALEAAARELDRMRHQQLGYAGALTLNEDCQDYRTERAALKQRWEALPVPLPWPLRANTHDQEPRAAEPGGGQAQKLPDEVSRFLDDLGQFLRKWQLTQLASWDLPLPQGPLQGLSLATARHLLGPGQLATTLPSYFDVPSDVDLRKRTRDQQRFAAGQAGVEARHPVTNLSARGGRASSPETAFRMWLVERTSRARYGSRRGLVARLASAFAAMFDISSERVHELRKTYTSRLDQ
jgi:hypothetical protein